MLITFKKIKLHNFCSFKDAIVDLSDMGYVLVSGSNKCKIDNAYSNGSGKSSIFNGICYALTGETAQGISSGLENIFSDSNECWVELELSVNNDDYIIKRSSTKLEKQSPKKDLKIIVNGEEKSGKGIKESNKILADFLPDLTSELVGSIIILGQGLPHRLSRNSPSGRKEVLEKLTKSDFMIKSIKDKLETRLEDLKNQLRDYEDNILSNKSKLEVLNSHLNELNDNIKQYQSYIFSDGSIDTALSILKEDIDRSSNLKAEVEKDIEIISNTINDLQSNKNNLIKEDRVKYDTESAVLNEEINKCSTELARYTAEINALNKEINKLKSIVDICPTCGQKMHDVKVPNTQPQENKLSSLKDISNDLSKKLKELQENKRLFIKNHDTNLDASLQYIENSIKYNNKELNKNQSSLKEIIERINQSNIELCKLSTLKENYNILISDRSSMEISINDLKEATSNLELEKSNVNSRISVVQQMIALAKRSFRGVLLSNVIELINKKVKQYSLEVFGNQELAFILNENSIDITYYNKLYDNLSGGEKQKIDIIVQLALRDILSKQLGMHFNMLVLDEIYDNMDSISCQKITNLISNLNEIDSVFIISHHTQDLEITYDNNIVVEKDENGISSVSFV